MEVYARSGRSLDNGLESAITADRVHKAVLPSSVPCPFAWKFKQAWGRTRRRNKKVERIIHLGRGALPNLHVYLLAVPNKMLGKFTRESPAPRPFPRSKERDKAELRVPVVLLKSIPSGTSNFKGGVPPLPRGSHFARSLNPPRTTRCSIRPFISITTRKPEDRERERERESSVPTNSTTF